MQFVPQFSCYQQFNVVFLNIILCRLSLLAADWRLLTTISRENERMSEQIYDESNEDYYFG
jgi:hypothetical protein